jgi:hypothetical protein
MCKPKAPKTPDPRVVADAQAAANIKTAQTQAELNRYDQETPFGTVSWLRDPDNPNKYTSTTIYDPVTQAILDQSKAGVAGLTNRANEVLSRPNAGTPGLQYTQDTLDKVAGALPDTKNLATSALSVIPDATTLNKSGIANLQNTISTPFNFNSAPDMPVANEATRNSVADALYNQAKSRLDPTYEQGASNLEAKLAAQGVTLGSDAYDRAMGNFMRDKNDAYTSASNTANMSGIDAMDRLFGMGMSARRQGVDEAQAIRDQASKEALTTSNIASGAVNNAANAVGTNITTQAALPAITGDYLAAATQGFTNENNARNQALNELGNARSILNSSIPNLQPGIAGDTNVATTPVADSIYNSYQGDLNKYAGDVGSRNNMLSGLAGLGGMAMMAPAGTFASMGSGIMSGLAALGFS